jgi:hypothetical protein
VFPLVCFLIPGRKLNISETNKNVPISQRATLFLHEGGPENHAHVTYCLSFVSHRGNKQAYLFGFTFRSAHSYLPASPYNNLTYDSRSLVPQAAPPGPSTDLHFTHSCNQFRNASRTAITVTDTAFIFLRKSFRWVHSKRECVRAGGWADVGTATHVDIQGNAFFFGGVGVNISHYGDVEMPSNPQTLGILGSNPTRGMDVCLPLFCVCDVLCR